ncbi:(4Fe-4S)-binding protein [Chitinophaga parva]|uniref:(4Fe-4S)-binding protein n=1 Tax=Chitinophaga parva TaxID=2169414 RepID=A0A2T7BN45_9BACT|nr:(4Fe-4S)-binding protein [Chitinophaga parva]PUZ29092.1 (4Fe-4S)-binding protein [Chitinophaga parva]
MNIIKHYTNGEVTIVWQPDVCIHSAKCFHGLPEVFDPREKPWIRPEGATTEQIVAQVERCPSGALSYFYNADEQA